MAVRVIPAHGGGLSPVVVGKLHISGEGVARQQTPNSYISAALGPHHVPLCSAEKLLVA